MAWEKPRSETLRGGGSLPHRWTRVDDPSTVSVVAAYDTVIVGAGPAGLTAAYELTRNGHSCVALEADPRFVGGISRTEEYKGYRFDIGGHRFFSKSQEVNRLWEEILGEQFLVRPRMSRIFYDQKFFHYPLKPADALLKLGPIKSFRILLSYLKARLKPIAPERSFEDWVVKPLRPHALRDLLQDLHRKSLGHAHERDLGRLGGPAHQGALAHRRCHECPVRPLKSRKGEVIKTLIDQFHYPRLGPGQMWEAARDRVVRWRQRCPHGPKGRQHRARRHGRHLRARPGWPGPPHPLPRQPLPVDHAGSAPCPGIHSSASRRSAPGGRLAQVPRLSHRGPHRRGPRRLPRHLDLHPRPRRQAGPNPELPQLVARPRARRVDKSSLGLEYFCFEGDDLWTMPDDQLIELGKREIAQIGLVTPDRVVDGCVVRMPKAYPVYDETYQQHLATIRGWLSSLGNLELAGRNGMHKYNNQDHSMMTALLAARNILGQGTYDTWKVNTDAEYHEAGVDESAPAGRAVPRQVAAA